jgi:hypothetical protein
MPPVIITIASPITTMPTNEKFRASLMRLSVLRKVGAANASSPAIMTSAMKIPASRDRAKREKRTANEGAATASPRSRRSCVISSRRSIRETSGVAPRRSEGVHDSGR